MEDFYGKKPNRKQSFEKKNKSKEDNLEFRSLKHQKHHLKSKKLDIEEDELWEEWRDYYKR